MRPSLGPPALILVDDPLPPPNPVQQALLDFYYGEQWPAGVRHDRLQKLRPCLTVNRLPLIVDAVLGIEGSKGTVTPARYREIILEVTRRMMDRQRVYNYLLSAEAESWADGRRLATASQPWAREVAELHQRTAEICRRQACQVDPAAIPLGVFLRV